MITYRVDSLIDIYQSNKLTGRELTNTLFYTIELDEAVDTHNEMSEYIQELHEVYDEEMLNSLSRSVESLCLKEEDVLVWKRKTTFEFLETENSSFMLIKLSYDEIQVAANLWDT